MQLSKLAAAFFVGAVLTIIAMMIFWLPQQETGGKVNSRIIDASPSIENIYETQAELLRVTSELVAQIEALNITLAKSGDAGNKQPGPEEQGKEKIKPSTSSLEELIERLIATIDNSKLSSERNTGLRGDLEGLSVREPAHLSSVWQTKESADTALFMQTYSHVLKKIGPPPSSTIGRRPVGLLVLSGRQYPVCRWICF